MDIDDKGRTDGGEQTGLKTSEAKNAEKIHGTYENQHDIQICMARFGEASIVFCRHPLVYRIKFETDVTAPDRL